MQVAAKDLPPYREVLQPLIPTESAAPVHTTDFKDGRRIPLLKELLLQAHNTPVGYHALAFTEHAEQLRHWPGRCCSRRLKRIHT